MSALLLFDLGGVLVENTTFESLARMLPGPPDPAAARRRWVASPAVRRHELGELNPLEFAAAFAEEQGIGLAPDAFLAEFATWPRGLYPGAPALLRTLRAQRRVACLSNSNAVHWQRFDGFAEDFDVSLSSHLLGAVKPDALAYERALRACGATAGETWFFDDLPGNVEAARALGLRAFLAEGFEALPALLRQEGLLPA